MLRPRVEGGRKGGNLGLQDERNVWHQLVHTQRMTTAFLRPIQLELIPAEPPQEQSHLFTVRALYREGGNWQVHPLVYVPDIALGLFRQGKVAGMHLEDLRANDSASRALRGAAASVVLGVELHDGTSQSTVPSELQAVRRRRLIQGAVLSIFGLGALSTTSGLWLGVAAFTVGSHLLRTALTVPVKPF